MVPWAWVLLLSGGLLLLYLLFFYFSSLLQRGSPFFIRLAYYAESAWEQACSIGQKLKGMTPKPQDTPQAKPARPLIPPDGPLKVISDGPVILGDLLPKSKPSSLASERKKDDRAKVQMSDARPGLAGSTTAPFTLAAAKRAIRERRRVWVKYREEGRQETEEKIEIYRAGLGDTLWVWCCLRHTRSTLRRSDIISWRLLDERFERAPHLEQWARWDGLGKMPPWVGRLLQKRP